MDTLTLENYDGSDTAKELLFKLAEVSRGTKGVVKLEIVAVSDKSRTLTQNRALHKYCELLAGVLNDAGFEQRKVIEGMKAGFDLPWSKESVKEWLYRPVMQAMTDKRSTTELDTVEPSKICDVLGRHLAEKYGITPPPFPSLETGGRL